MARIVFLVVAVGACVVIAQDQKPAPASEKAGVVVDLYNPAQPSGKVGEACTAAMLQANMKSSGYSAVWSITGTVLCSEKYPRSFPAPLRIGGRDVRVVGTRCLEVPDSSKDNKAILIVEKYAKYAKQTIAAFVTPGGPYKEFRRFDTIGGFGNPWFIAQTSHKGGKVYFNSHGQDDKRSTYGPLIAVKPGKTYWVNIHFDGVADMCKLSVFDPDNNYALVGTSDCVTGRSAAHPTKSEALYKFGRGDGIAQGSPGGSTFFSHIMIDITDGTYPLFPDSKTIKKTGASGKK